MWAEGSEFDGARFVADEGRRDVHVCTTTHMINTLQALYRFLAS